VAYEIRPSGGPERSCTFQLRAVTVAREEVLIPLRPVELIADDAWHTLVLPVPGHLRGRKIRYYMLLLGGDVREILFNNLYFG
jgi:hypothetical protein